MGTENVLLKFEINPAAPVQTGFTYTDGPVQGVGHFLQALLPAFGCFVTEPRVNAEKRYDLLVVYGQLGDFQPVFLFDGVAEEKRDSGTFGPCQCLSCSTSKKGIL